MQRSLIGRIKELTVIPGVYGYSPLLNNKKIHNYKYSLLRKNFWVFMAKHNKYYKRFYSEIKGEIKSPKLNDVKAQDLNDICIKLDQYGVSFIPDFFPNNQYDQVISYINQKKEKDLYRMNDGYQGNVKYWDHPIKDDYSFMDNLKESISYISKKLLFPLSKNRIRINYTKLIKEDKVEDGDTNTIFHSDRFIPTLKFFYYPYSCEINQSPFEFLPFSHFISNKFLSSYQKYFLDVSKNLKSSLPCALDYSTGADPLSMTVPKNSLVASFTHGIHRRRPFPTKNNNHSTFERNIIGCSLYNQQTKLSFLKLSP